MGLEVATYINDLVITNPLGTDTMQQGDDHLRMLKSVLKNTLPLAIGPRRFRDDTAGASDASLVWTMYRNKNGAANDYVGSYAVSGNNAAGSEKTLLRLRAQWVDPTATSENSRFLVSGQVAGVETTMLSLDSTGMNIVYPLTGAGKPFTQQNFTANGTWTKPSGCRKIMIFACGGGGGGGGVRGIGSGNAAAAGGGGSGYSAWTNIIDVSAVASFPIVIGNGGAGGIGASNTAGGNGGDTTAVISAITYTWAGGGGAPSPSANTSPAAVSDSGVGGMGTNLNGYSIDGTFGATNASAGGGGGTGGNGGSSMFGKGGSGGHFVGNGNASGGGAVGFGAGGGGAINNNSASPVNGGAGSAGLMKVIEYY